MNDRLCAGAEEEWNEAQMSQMDLINANLATLNSLAGKLTADATAAVAAPTPASKQQDLR